MNEYEKSVFLTKAQNQLVTEYFNNRVDQVGGGFDGSQKRQYDFSSLIKTAELEALSSEDLGTFKKIDKRSLCYLFPQEYFLAVNEILSDDRYQYNVMPLSYDEYARLMLKPYAYPVKKGAWRLITGKMPVYEGEPGEEELVGYQPIVEIVGNFGDNLVYTLRYIKKPAPIVLVNLEVEGYEDLEIDGVDTVSQCELPEETHQEILERAVTLAKIAWAGGTATQAQSQRSRE
jgi:hypothetical protein